MAVVRKQRRVDGKKQNYYWDTELCIEVAAPVRKKHYSIANPMQGLIGYAVMHDSELKQGITDAFANFNGSQMRNGLTGISIPKLIELADTQPELYSTEHPESTNHAAYDAALTMLLVLVRERIPEWEEAYRYDMHNSGLNIVDLMCEQGYDTDNYTGAIANSLNQVWSEGKLLVGTEANKHWLKSQGFSKLRSQRNRYI
ncbi:hypothetical protein [Escherichia phage vB_EcoP_PAS7]|uniref:Uncharacterized protein n=1 Tax=Escherichia phage vB_EcoP_PAS7 TaxID=3053875 RepID=A0AA51Z375_9CAUD|nr:hypothetical protein [Escherichia phage vB_EcoP_PAS7]